MFIYKRRSLSVDEKKPLISIIVPVYNVEDITLKNVLSLWLSKHIKI